MGRAGVRRLGLMTLTLALIVGPVFVRVWIDGQAALAEAQAASRAGDDDAELRWLGRAARFRLPLATHDDRARGQMLARAEQATEAGDHARGLACWRELRRATLATRGVGLGPDARAQVERANVEIVALMTAQAHAAGEVAASERWASELDEGLAPRARSVAAAACFALFVLSTLGFFALAIDAKGRLDPRRATRLGGVVLVALVAWISLM